MDEKDSLKLEAIETRQDLEMVVKLFESFKQYVYSLLKWINDDIADLDLSGVHEAFRLRIEDEEHRFLEWKNGDQVWNESVHRLVFEKESYGDLDTLTHDIVLATVKFEHLLEKGKRELIEIHEKIEVLTSAAEAEKVTQLAPEDKKKSLTEKVKIADQTFETVFKWGKRAIEIAPWLLKILSDISH